MLGCAADPHAELTRLEYEIGVVGINGPVAVVIDTVAELARTEVATRVTVVAVSRIRNEALTGRTVPFAIIQKRRRVAGSVAIRIAVTGADVALLVRKHEISICSIARMPSCPRPAGANSRIADVRHGKRRG